MESPDILTPDFADLLKAASAHSVKYVVVGAFALAGHGHPRATGDLDLFIEASEENGQKLLCALRESGFPTPFTIADIQTPELVLFIGYPPGRVDFLTSITDVSFEEAWKERLHVEIDGVAFPILSRELLIRNKRAAGRPKDIVDLLLLERPIEPPLPR